MKAYISRRELERALKERGIIIVVDVLELDSQHCEAAPTKGCDVEIAADVFCANPKETCSIHKEQPKCEHEFLVFSDGKAICKKCKVQVGEEHPEKVKDIEILRPTIEGDGIAAIYHAPPPGDMMDKINELVVAVNEINTRIF
jgi:hypothetical protein